LQFTSIPSSDTNIPVLKTNVRTVEILPPVSVFGPTVVIGMWFGIGLQIFIRIGR